MIFSAPVDPTTFTRSALRLNEGAVGSVVSIAAIDDSGTRFALSGLGAAQTVDGDYALTVDATALAGLDGTAGVDSYTATWTRDTQPPVLQSVSEETGEFGDLRFVLAFNEEIETNTMSLDNIHIRRRGVPLLGTQGRAMLGAGGWVDVTMPETAEVRSLGGGRVAIVGIASVLAGDGEYEISANADGVEDEAGNVGSGSVSMTLTVDRTPPAQITDLAISPDGGFSDADGITYTGELTVSGTLPEANLTVEIIAKYVGGGETVLTTLPTAGGDTLPAGVFSQNIVMPGTGNATLVVRLTDAAGNSSDSEKGVSVDGIALTGTLTGASDDEGVVTTSATLTLSDRVMEGDVALEKFSLTRDGEAVALEGVTLSARRDGSPYQWELSGLDVLCAEDGVYVLRFDGSAVRKYSSGLLMSGSLVMRWRYENPDREPPTVTEVLFDGETPHEAYTNVFSSVSVTFNEAVNVPELIEKGLIGRAARIDLLDATGVVTGCVATVAGQPPYRWDAESNMLSWQIEGEVDAGRGVDNGFGGE